ncbi:MAG: tryptophan--tRNA ligase, partial [Moorella sp. (in: Bacteria)]|nr:tryptophan--tRNA ligase [Moorella sp. (in: firmicutes)]
MRILSGMRPTGRLHIGHLSVLENWVRLQEENECFYFISDWHALTTGYDNTAELKDNIRDMLLDWLGAGLDPEKSTIFVQSHVKEHAELHLLFSMFTPLSWLERVPSYKDQIQQLGREGKDISTYGFLGYPVLMAADILIYLADAVPVGEDQLPHLELCREIARRFNFLYKTSLFPEPRALLAKVAMLPGVDGRKMSKSYHNDIPMSAAPEEVREKVRMMVTDPARIHRTDPGHPEICLVHTYHEIYNSGEVEETRISCRGGRIGCVACKQRLAEKINAVLEPVRERRVRWEARPEMVAEILATGDAMARATASRTLA